MEVLSRSTRTYAANVCVTVDGRYILFELCWSSMCRVNISEIDSCPLSIFFRRNHPRCFHSLGPFVVRCAVDTVARLLLTSLPACRETPRAEKFQGTLTSSNSNTAKTGIILIILHGSSILANAKHLDIGY